MLNFIGTSAPVLKRDISHLWKRGIRTMVWLVGRAELVRVYGGMSVSSSSWTLEHVTEVKVRVKSGVSLYTSLLQDNQTDEALENQSHYR